MTTIFKSRCAACNRGEPYGKYDGRFAHNVREADGFATLHKFICLNFDDECRSYGEPLGFYTFAWLPKRCRNGRLRWLRPIEDHGDGTFTLGNRAF